MKRSCCAIAQKGGATYCGVCGLGLDSGRRSRLRIYWDLIARTGLFCLTLSSVAIMAWLTADAGEAVASKASASQPSSVVQEELVDQQSGEQQDIDVESESDPSGRGDRNHERQNARVGEDNQRVSQLMAQWRPARREEAAAGQGADPTLVGGTASPAGIIAAQPSAGALRPVLLSASSHTTGSRVVSYSPYNAIDGDLETGWQVSNGGVGEWIRLEFGRLASLRRIGVVPGYDKVRADRVGDRFPANNRVSEATITWEGGSTTHRFADDRAMQFIELGSVSTSWVQIYITAIAPGSRWNDTVISEIRCEGAL